MFIERLILTNFRCFGPAPLTIDLTQGLTAFVGVNGAGKTAADAGPTAPFRRDWRSATPATPGFSHSLHRDWRPSSETSSSRQSLPFLNSTPTAPAAAIPEFFHQMAADEAGKLKCRLRLEATWTDDGSLDGAIEQKYWAIRTFGAFTDA